MEYVSIYSILEILMIGAAALYFGLAFYDDK